MLILEAKSFERMLRRKDLDNLINGLKLWTNQQKDGDSPVGSIVTGLREKSRKGIMDGLRKFIEVEIAKQFMWEACARAANR